MDPNAEKFDTEYLIRAIKENLGDAVVYDTVSLDAVLNNAEHIMRKKAYGEMYAVMPMRFPPMP